MAERIINGWELNGQWDMKTFYGTQNQEKGYSDYPFYSKWFAMLDLINYCIKIKLSLLYLYNF